MNQIELFTETLPLKPYCTNNLTYGSLIRPKAQAIKMRYIQPNTPWNWTWLVQDIDRASGATDWFDRGCPAPNIISENPENGHAHLFYGLGTPIHCQGGSKSKPFRYGSAVSVALSRKLDADPRYGGLLAKNPLNPNWNNQWVDPLPYTLGGLASYLDLSDLGDTRKHLPEIGLGRNCTLFDETRLWSYRAIRKAGLWLGEDFFISAVTEYAAGYNQQNFTSPLQWAEVKAIGKSVGKWTYRNMSPEGFRAWADGRRAKSVRVRKAGAFEKGQMVKLYKETHPEASIRAIARELNVSIGAISQYLRS